MRASLVSREVIADSMSSSRAATCSTALCLVGCDKTIPAAVMALARLDLPGLVLYNGSIAPGRFRGKRRDHPGRLRAIGAHAVGKMTGEELHELERRHPGAGACGGQFTANTMSTASSSWDQPGGLNGIPALVPAKQAAAEQAGRWSWISSVATCAPRR